MATVNLPKIYFLKNAKKTCKPNNRGLTLNVPIPDKGLKGLHKPFEAPQRSVKIKI